MDQIVPWSLFLLRPHPRNNDIFGDPRLIPEYPEIKESIKTKGLQEPLIVKPDGTILSGHLRYHILLELASEAGKQSHEVEVPVRVKGDLGTDNKELEYLFEANLERRQLTPRQIAGAYTALIGAAVEETKGKGGRPRKNDLFKNPNERKASTKERVARLLHVSPRTADHIALIFQTAGVPADVLDRVDTKHVSIQLAADAVKFSIVEAYRKNPDLITVVIDPVDVRTFIDNSPMTRRAKMSDMLRGIKLVPVPPVTLEGHVVTKYHTPIELSLPPAFRPKQNMGSMIRSGVQWSEADHSDHGLPLHEGLQRIRTRLNEVLNNATLVREDKVEPILDLILDRITHFIRTTGKEVTINIGGKKKGTQLPEEFLERLLLLRLCLDESDPNLDQAILRRTLLDIATTARDRANSIVKARAVKPRTEPKKAVTTFDSEMDFILHVLGDDTVYSMS